MIVWPGKKVKASHIATATGVRVVHSAWAIRLGRHYLNTSNCALFTVDYYGPSPGKFELNPDITISYNFISFCSKLNVFKSN